MDERWCEATQRFYNPTEWRLHLRLCEEHRWPIPHTCHALGCETPVPPRLLMCNPHWRMVPKRWKDAVLSTYVPGQEVSKMASNEYIKAARGAVNAVAMREGQPTTSNPFLPMELVESK